MKTILTHFIASLTTPQIRKELIPQLIPVRVITNNFPKKGNH